MSVSAVKNMSQMAVRTAETAASGGDVIFVVDEGLNTLTDLSSQHVNLLLKTVKKAAKRNCHGKDGADLILKVPAGTVIKDAESDKVIADMSGDNKRQVILKGRPRRTGKFRIMQQPPCRHRNTLSQVVKELR